MRVQSVTINLWHTLLLQRGKEIGQPQLQQSSLTEIRLSYSALQLAMYTHRHEDMHTHRKTYAHTYSQRTIAFILDVFFIYIICLGLFSAPY